MRRLSVTCPGWDLEPNDTRRRQPLALLREALVNGPSALNQLEKEGVIQRFEYCFELAWKTTKDYIEANGFVFAVVMP
jgi:hypothetical protein